MTVTRKPIGQPSITSNQPLVEQLRRFNTFAELRRSEFFQTHRTELARLLDEPRVYESPAAQPRLRAFLRVVEWNIERGTQFDGIVEVLNHHPVLGYADLLLLNELDDGMVRSGNRNVARELSHALGAHAVYAAEYLELTKGTGDELTLPGENTTALHGNAILTRHRVARPQVVSLPRCENNFESAEKRLGGRIGIIIDLQIGAQLLIATTAHLDVVNTPRCRARQMRALLEAVDARAQQSPSANQPIIFGGDLNTHTFARGNRLRAMQNTAIILGSRRQRLAQRLAHPERKEPAIGELARFGYDTAALNDRTATARSFVSGLDDRKGLPAPLRWWVRQRLGSEGLTLALRLDWLAACGLRALRAGQMTDVDTGVISVDPQTFNHLKHNGQRLSDHDPIVVDLAI